MAERFALEIHDVARAATLRGRLLAGRWFAFADGVVHPLAGEPIALPGVLLRPSPRSTGAVACLVADRDLYRADVDRVHLFAAVPRGVARTALVVRQHGAPYATRELSFEGGVALESIGPLPAGSYTAELRTALGPIGAQASFTAAAYELAPLSAALVAHQLVQGILRFTLEVERWDAPHTGPAPACALVNAAGREVARARLEEAVSPGRFDGDVPLIANGHLRVSLGGDTAEVVVPGARAEGAAEVTIGALGDELALSPLPAPASVPMRGAFLSKRGRRETPLVAGPLVASRGSLCPARDLSSLVLLHLDPLTGALRVDPRGDVRAGEELSFEVPSPLGTVFAGAFVEGAPFEGHASFVHPPSFTLGLDAPARVRPRETIPIHLSAADARVLLTVRDRRLTAAAPEPTLASSLLHALEDAVSGAGAVKPVPIAMHASAIRGARADTRGAVFPAILLDGLEIEREPLLLVPRDLARKHRLIPINRAGTALVVAASAPPTLFAIDDLRFVTGFDIEVVLASAEEIARAIERHYPEQRVYYDALEGPEVEASEAAVSPRASFPPVLFHGLVHVRGEEVVHVPAGEGLGTFTVEAFAACDGDWASAKREVRVHQAVRAALDVPEVIHPGDAVPARAHAASDLGGPLRLTVLRDGVEVARAAGPSPVALALEATAGVWSAHAEDLGSGERDEVIARAGAPGVLRTTARRLLLVPAGEPLPEGAHPLPDARTALRDLAEATADYAHACCEQTAARILAAAALLLASAGDARKREKAEAAIAAGIAREETMWRRGRGFALYPDQPGVSERYGPMAVRHLWAALPRLDLSGGLREVAQLGLAMADDAGAALGMERAPRRPRDAEEAYAAISAGGDRAAAEAVLRARRPPRASPTLARREDAYAAASWLALGRVAEALPLANRVLSSIGADGRLHSTADSAAAVALLSELDARGIGSGVVTAERVEVVEEDWRTFGSTFPIRVGYHDREGRGAARFREGDRLTLSVHLDAGYHDGDLLHLALPACLSWLHGGARVKRLSLDFAGAHTLEVPLAVTAPIGRRQRWALAVTNMFDESRASSPGPISIEGA